MKTLLAAAILTLTLAISASAGQIQCPGAKSTESGTTTSIPGNVTTTIVVTVVSASY